MPSALAIAGQAAVYGLVAVTLGLLSDTPAYRHFQDDRAEFVLSFSHGGSRKGPCRTLTEEEIGELAPNMRRKSQQVCPRERVPVVVELSLNGSVLIGESLPPGGLAGDGPSRIYRRIEVAVGQHDLYLRLRDTDRAEGFDYEIAKQVTLTPRQRYVVDFRGDLGGFVLGGAPVNREQ